MQTYNIISRAKEKGLTGSLLFVYIVQDLKFIFHLLLYLYDQQFNRKSGQNKVRVFKVL